ncbi:MAG: metallophosphoesterase [Clostridiales bacterium]|nr:metallophosphoesterase [Clostridiales bacterium]
MPEFLIYIIGALFAVFFFALVAMAARAVIEPYLLDVDVEEITVPAPRFSSRSDQTGSFSGEKEILLRIAFFSDIHGKGCKVPRKKLLDALFSQPCDVMLFGGDIADSGSVPQAGLAWMKIIADIASEKGIPCYAVKGNHDRKVTREQIESTGFRLLLNEYAEIKGRSGARFLLIGLDDSGKINRVWPDLPGDLPEDIPPEHRIVFVHNPDYVLNQKNPGEYHIQLSGHLHGGQIILPFKIQYTVLRGDQLPREGITQGLFFKNRVTGYITRGVGCGFVPLRFLAKPQVSHLKLVAGPQRSGRPVEAQRVISTETADPPR